MKKQFRSNLCMLFIVLLGAVSAHANVVEEANSVQQQQSIPIKGVIHDNHGEPLIGVSIVEKGTTNGTITNIDGEFNITVRSTNAQLDISYVGYTTQTITVGAQRNLSIILSENVTGLDEVVVVGYGTQKKATLTGSISQVSGDELKKQAAINVTNTLAGKTAGVIANVRSGEPGEDNANILIRGKGTTGKTDPLIVVDGIADRDFARLNPEDIESISVLKDASAAIYGARAANGVILVTTKRGSEGKIGVNYSGNISFSQPTRVPEMLNSYQYATYINEYDVRHGSMPTYTDEAIAKILDGSDLINYSDINWWDAVAKSWAPRTQHSLSVSGGSDKISFYSSFQYAWQDAIYRDSPQDYSQYQLTTNIDAKISNKVRFSMDILGRQEARNRGIYETDYMFTYFLKTSPMVPAKYPNGLYRGGVDGVTRNAAIMVTDLPGTDNSKRNFLNLKPRLRIDLDIITQGLFVEGYAAIDLGFNNGKTINQPYDIYVYNAATQEYENKRGETGKISLNSWSENSDRITLNAKIGYSRTFGDHKIDAFAAYEQSKYNFNNVEAYRTNYLSTTIMQIFAGSDNPEDRSNGGYGDISARQNYFGRINYGYQDKYLAEVTMRYDGSMNFPDGKRWGLFPAFSLGWVMSEEGFFAPYREYVNFLKLKGSWGMMGNDNVDPFQFLSRYGFIEDGKQEYLGSGVMFGDDVYKGLYQMVAANPEITWETAKTTNIGIQAQFLNNKLNFELDVFKSKRDNILARRQASIPNYAGLVLPSENIGKMNNQGLEIIAGYQDRTGDFNYGVTGNFTYAKNKIIFNDEAEATPEWQKATGHPIDSYTLYDALGIYQTQEEVDNSVHIAGAKPGDLIYRDVNGDGEITGDDMIRVHDSPTPRIMYGFTLNGAWKGIDLNIFFQGQAQAKMMVMPTMNMMTEFYDGRWSEANTAEQNLKAKYPRAMIKQTYADDYNGRESTWWLRDAAFLRLKSVELGYTLPKPVSRKAGIEHVRIYVNANNLFTFSGIKGFDPEISTTANTDNPARANGIGAYPMQRTITAGLNVTF